MPDKTLCRLKGEKSEDLHSRTIAEKTVESDISDVADVVSIKFDCEDADCNIDSLEHVQAVINVQHPQRGQLEALLVSPSGTKSHILSPRPRDLSDKGFQDWSLMTVESWGEPASGSWHLYIVNRAGREAVWSVGECQLLLHGTERTGSGGAQ